MSTSASRFKVIEPFPVAGVDPKHTEDHQYWRGLQFPITIKEFGAVTNVAFQPTKPNFFAVSASTRVILYNPENNESVKTFSRFHDVAYGATFRRDGRLLVAGNADAKVRLFDVDGRVPLRIFKGHTRPVRVTKFCNNMKEIFSAGDDNSVRVWDIPTEKVLHKFDHHQDYVRCGCVSRNADNIILTGSYDHTVRMFDTRSDECTMIVNHGCPVESVLMYPSGSILLSAGGNRIKVWDVLQGGRLLATVSHHHKTITCLRFNHDCTRILSGSLDRHVKIYDVATYNVVHNIDYSAPILSLDVAHEDKTLVVGMADSMLSIRHRKQAVIKEQKEDEVLLSRRKRRQRSHFMGGQTFVPNQGDVIIHHKHKEQLEKYDVYFRKFEHGKALDAALIPQVHMNTPEITVAVFEELIRRDTIHAALAGKGEKKLSVLLKFLIRNITNISFAPVLMDVAEMVVDIYSQAIEDVPVSVINLFQRLRDIIRREGKLQIEMHKLLGCMDTIVSSNSQNIKQSDVDEATINASNTDPVSLKKS
ncbi:unnamed protein product [Clavelina lepadiformis]|uniref:U3 small nucleolar RNA-associated protein 15 homolog n=1 Tax=Clavelina lepadiformis TaxID=159417 RepID=A0ABP0GQ43_CLALP